MAYKFTENTLGWQPIATTSTVKNHPLGTIRRATDPTFGEGEFIYLLGVTGTVIGTFVNYDDSYQTAINTGGLQTPRPVAVAMSANVGSAYGWYQIGGLAVGLKANSVSFAKGSAFGVATGKAIAVATGQILNGALVAVVASAKSTVTSVRVMINRPHEPSDVS
jgi:hypothetical protein